MKGPIFKELMDIARDIEENKDKITGSLQGAWEVFSRRYKCTCGKCEPMPPDVLQEFKEAFIGGAAALTLVIKKAHESGEEGAIRKAMDEAMDWCDEGIKRKVQEVLSRAIQSIFSSHGIEDDDDFPTEGTC